MTLKRDFKKCIRSRGQLALKKRKPRPQIILHLQMRRNAEMPMIAASCSWGLKFVFCHCKHYSSWELVLLLGSDWSIPGGCHLSIMQSWAWAILLQGQGERFIVWVFDISLCCYKSFFFFFFFLFRRPASNTTVAPAGIGSIPWTSSAITALWCETRRSGTSTEATHGSSLPQPGRPLRLLPREHCSRVGLPQKKPFQELGLGETL